ncbi:hypothetical protein [Roseibaca sp. Y0-43]|uniref:hypothetical protein n=1 Tax=Roseibaca sp. Y0-43 TaxID=2816854 RepID=UPI001D0C9072|nr:hypothetical protein [Roseibaca sp. Y0-43]MCC1481676.1 hypothetical protein [Roseibaca sp. Y0-43]
MNSLTPLATCLSAALNGVLPVPTQSVVPGLAVGGVLAGDVVLPHDMPPVSEALRAGVAVAALDLVGASPGAPVPLSDPVAVVPGAALPPGTDAVLPEDGIERWGAMAEAMRPLSSGDGARRAGHDGRAGAVLVQAETRLTARHAFAARQAGVQNVTIRRPRVAVQLDDPTQADFVAAWLADLGAELGTERPDLTLRRTPNHAPRLALGPAETAWLARDAAGLVLDLPARFDGMVAALYALALPALARLSGASPRADGRPLARKVTSTVGLSELVLLQAEGDAWLPQPAGLVTLSALATAHAFAILPPESEGCAAGTPLAATPLDQPLG